MRSIGSRGALSGPGLQLSELAAPAPATAAPAPDTEALAPGEAESALAPDAAGKPHTGIDPDDRDIAKMPHANCVLDEASRTPAPDQDPETIYILSGS